VLTLINFGSAVGFNAIISLISVSLTFSYVITMSCTTWKRLYGGGLPPERFSLGAFGLPINIMGILMMSPITVLAV